MTADLTRPLTQDDINTGIAEQQRLAPTAKVGDPVEDWSIEDLRSVWARAKDDPEQGELRCWGPTDSGWEASIWLTPTHWALCIDWETDGSPDPRHDYWSLQVGPLTFTVGKVVAS